jgi:hypothetical protein
MILFDPEKYISVGEWYQEMRAQGYSVPLQLCVGLSRLIKKYNLTFDEAFNFMVKHEKVMLVGRTFIYDLTADNL